jgi:HlyD family secretion protein
MIGPQGIVELGRVDRMYAIAEVYETDIGRVRVGQRATVSSRALARPLSGVVERIRQQVRKQDQLGTDPAARKDARIVEVEIRLADSAPAASLTNLQVEVLIGSLPGR